MTFSQIFFSFVLLQLQAILMTTPNTQRKIVLKALQKVEGLNTQLEWFSHNYMVVNADKWYFLTSTSDEVSVRI